MIKPVKPILVGPILLIGFGVILIIGVVIWQMMVIQHNLLPARPQSGPAPTLAIPHTNTEYLVSADFQRNAVRLNGSENSGKYLDFSFTRL